MTVDGFLLSSERNYQTLRLDLPAGFESCYGAPPLAQQHRGVPPLVGGAVQGTRETFQAAVAYYKQQLQGFKGIADESTSAALRALMFAVRQVLGPTFGPIVPFLAHGRLYGTCPGFLVEDGADSESPMRGVRPVLFQLDYALENPHNIDELGTNLVADLIRRGIPVAGPLTAKLPLELKNKNKRLFTELLKVEEIGILGG